MITIYNCTRSDVDLILKAEPFNGWLGPVHQTVGQVISFMLRPREDCIVRIIEHVQNVSMHIWRQAQKMRIPMDGQLMNATWSDEYLTINIPMGNEEFGILRFRKCVPAPLLDLELSFPDPSEFMSSLARRIPNKAVGYDDHATRMSLKHAAFLSWCEWMKPGLSAPFRDMIEDGVL